MKRFAKAIAILLSVLMLCSMAGCASGGEKALLNGHKWGETENQTNAKGWDNATFAGYKIGGNKHAYPVSARHGDKGLYEVDYSLVVVNKDEDEVYKKLVKELGKPADSGDYYSKTEYIWYKDGDTVRITVILNSAKQDFDNANGEKTVTMSVEIYNDKYR